MPDSPLARSSSSSASSVRQQGLVRAIYQRVRGRRNRTRRRQCFPELGRRMATPHHHDSSSRIAAAAPTAAMRPRRAQSYRRPHGEQQTTAPTAAPRQAATRAAGRLQPNGRTPACGADDRVRAAAAHTPRGGEASERHRSPRPTGDGNYLRVRVVFSYYFFFFSLRADSTTRSSETPVQRPGCTM